MDNKNILKQARHDIFTELDKVITFYNSKGASFSSLKKYYKKKTNLNDLLEDIRNKSNHMIPDENEYKKFVKEILFDMLNDKIAREKDQKSKIKTFESFKNNKQ